MDMKEKLEKNSLYGKKKPDINKTQLSVERAAERKIIHRDYAAHFFRWQFACKFVNKMSMKVLDVGSGDGSLLLTLYTNKRKPMLYAAVDIRKNALATIDSLGKKVNFPVETNHTDLRSEKLKYADKEFDVVTCFEVVEHFEKEHIQHLLSEVKRTMKDDGAFLLSTPNFNGSQAGNHIHEYTEPELRGELEKHFKIVRQFGTFSSKPDIYPVLSAAEKEVYDSLKEYYDTNVLSVIFAPNHPMESRNILWLLEKK